MTGKGFARGDFDTSFELDLRYRAMHRDQPAAVYYAAAGVYHHLMAATWREGRRVRIASIPDAPPEAVAALRSAGLLDFRGMVRESAFNHWVRPALKRRDEAAERMRRSRAARAQSRANAHSDSSETDSARSMSRARSRLSGQDVYITESKTSTKTTESESQPESSPTAGALEEERWAEPEAAAIAWITSHGGFQNITTKVRTDLGLLVEHHGSASVVAAFEAIHAEDPAVWRAAQYVYGASNRLDRIPAAPAGKPETADQRQIREMRERVEARRRAKQNGVER